MMPGTAALKARFQQEVAPRVAMDRAEIVSTSVTLTTPAGRFTNCVKVEETKDGSLQLVSYGSDHR
jgi:hypothetical protein